jgi:hypothetical protein
MRGVHSRGRPFCLVLLFLIRARKQSSVPSGTIHEVPIVE